MNEQLISPCGMNCSICASYLAVTHDIRGKGIQMPYCTGCRPSNRQCSFIKKRCSLLLKGKVQYCFQCPDYPCEQLQKIDKRYRSLYRMSMIENLENIKNNGIAMFIKSQQEQWKCPVCGDTICCHNGICFSCGLEMLKDRKSRKMLYRWSDSEK